MIFICGQNGQLARALKQIDPARVQNLSRVECDLSRPNDLKDTLMPILESNETEFLINAGAYTQVDLAESQPDLCTKMNTESPIQMARLCKQAGIPFIHYSSDYVYGNNGADSLTESSPTHPLNFYAKTKLEGDQGIQAENGTALILRTSWVYDAYGKNFFTTMMNLFQQRETLKVVSDQIGAPSYAPDLAWMTFHLSDQIRKVKGTEVIHLTNEGQMSWHQFAQLIFEEARKHQLQGITREILPILTSDWPTPAKRQLNSRLSLEKLKSRFGLKPRTVSEALQECMKDYAVTRSPSYSP